MKEEGKECLVSCSGGGNEYVWVNECLTDTVDDGDKGDDIEKYSKI